MNFKHIFLACVLASVVINGFFGAESETQPLKAVFINKPVVNVSNSDFIVSDGGITALGGRNPLHSFQPNSKQVINSDFIVSSGGQVWSCTDPTRCSYKQSN